MTLCCRLTPPPGWPICDEAARRAPSCHESSHRTHPAKIVEFSSIWKVVWRYLTSRPLIQIATQAPSPSSYSGLRRTARDAEGAGWGARCSGCPRGWRRRTTMAECRLRSARRGPARCRAAAARGFKCLGYETLLVSQHTHESWSSVRTAPGGYEGPRSCGRRALQA